MNNVLQELSRLNNYVEKVTSEDLLSDEYVKLESFRENNTLITCTITGFKKSTKSIPYFMVTIEGLKRYTGIVKVDDVVRVQLDENRAENWDKYVGEKVVCRVHEVFSETQTVIVNRNFDDVCLALKEEIDKLDVATVGDFKVSKYDMKRMLSVADFPIVTAKVLGYVKETTCVVVDIYDLGLRCRVPVSVWDWAYRSEKDILRELREKEYISVALIGYRESPNYEGKLLYFIGSKIIYPEKDIFYKIDKRFTADSVIVVKCLKVDNNYFWGKNDLFEGEIMCYYDDVRGNVNKVIVGEKYLVRVKKVSEKDRKFTCSFVKKMEDVTKKSITEI